MLPGRNRLNPPVWQFDTRLRQAGNPGADGQPAFFPFPPERTGTKRRFDCGLRLLKQADCAGAQNNLLPSALPNMA